MSDQQIPLPWTPQGPGRDSHGSMASSVADSVDGQWESEKRAAAASFAPCSTEAQNGFPAPGPFVLNNIVFEKTPEETNKVSTVNKVINNLIIFLLK